MSSFKVIFIFQVVFIFWVVFIFEVVLIFEVIFFFEGRQFSVTPNIRGIAHAQTNRKDDIFMQRQLVQNFTFILEWGKGLVHWRSTHGAGHIPGILSLHAAYSALRNFFQKKKRFFPEE